MDEFSLIRNYLAPLSGAGGLGLLDDAAIYTAPEGFDLVLTMDSFVEGVHFANGRYGGDTAERLLRTNLSDFAAKGARPVGYLLSIAWPRTANIKIFEGFAAGLRDAQQSYDFTLFGGDTVSTAGPMVISASFFGLVPSGQMVKRSGALPGDDVWVTGSLGAAMLGCNLATGQAIEPPPNGAALWAYETAYLRPEPRLLFRKALRKYASACADISDGILSDASHICRASHVSMKLDFTALPVHSDARQWAQSQERPQDAIMKLISFGDDYELIFTASAQFRQDVLRQGKLLDLDVSRIGRVHPRDISVGSGSNSAKTGENDDNFVTCYGEDGQVIEFGQTGYRHNL